MDLYKKVSRRPGPTPSTGVRPGCWFLTGARPGGRFRERSRRTVQAHRRRARRTSNAGLVGATAWPTVSRIFVPGWRQPLFAVSLLAVRRLSGDSHVDSPTCRVRSVAPPLALPSAVPGANSMSYKQCFIQQIPPPSPPQKKTKKNAYILAVLCFSLLLLAPSTTLGGFGPGSGRTPWHRVWGNALAALCCLQATPRTHADKPGPTSNTRDSPVL